MILTFSVALARRPPPAEPPPPLQEVTARLVGATLVSREPWERLEVLCDDIGHRLAGSPELDRAIAWGADAMVADGLANVHREAVQVPVWVRGGQSARLVGPLERPLHVFTLGGSVGTPEGGIEAEVLVVGSFDELDARAAEARGRIVLFDVPFTDYGETVEYRVNGASRAAAHGAVAVLVRSVSPTSLDTPHTGMMMYDGLAAQIPAAAVTLEDATAIRRLAARGRAVRVHLELGAHTAPDAPSANVIGEVVGRELPGEVVLLACHLDSWDVGQGAQDDGAGCVSVMGAADAIAALPWRPRRTVRVVLYTNEENGLRGGRAYAEAHAGETHHAALEVDTGSGQPLGWRVARGEDPVGDEVLAPVRALAPLFASVGATEVTADYAGADIGPLTRAGVLSLGLDQDTTGYWPIHHTDADTFDKVDPVLLARNTAAVAVMAWALADEPSPGAP